MTYVMDKFLSFHLLLGNATRGHPSILLNHSQFLSISQKYHRARRQFHKDFLSINYPIITGPLQETDYFFLGFILPFSQWFWHKDALPYIIK